MGVSVHSVSECYENVRFAFLVSLLALSLGKFRSRGPQGLPGKGFQLRTGQPPLLLKPVQICRNVAQLLRGGINSNHRRDGI
jgi:hypothetical protein